MNSHTMQKPKSTPTPIRPLAWLLVIAGLALLVFGASKMAVASSDLSHLYAGAPAERAVWSMVLGLAMLVGGLVNFLPVVRKRKRRRSSYRRENTD